MVLLVEDDDSTRELLCEIMDNIHIDYMAASSSEEGIAVVKKDHPDILLIDMMLGNGETARPLIELCKKYYPSCKSILITAMNKVKAEEFSKDVGVDFILLKPFNIEELENTLHLAGC